MAVVRFELFPGGRDWRRHCEPRRVLALVDSFHLSLFSQPQNRVLKLTLANKGLSEHRTATQ